MESMTIQVPLETFLRTHEVIVNLSAENTNLKKMLQELRNEIINDVATATEEVNDGAGGAEYVEPDSERNNNRKKR